MKWSLEMDTIETITELKNKSKKIAIIGPAYPYRGGLAAFNERLAYELQNEFLCDVQLFTFTLQYPSFLFPGKSQYATGNPNFSLKILRLINAVNPFNWFYSAYVIARFKPDLVLVRFWLPFMGPCLGTISYLLKWFTGTTNICIVDNIIPHEKRVGDRFFTHYFIPSIDHFITMSSQVHQDLDQFLQKRHTKKLLFHPIYDNYGSSISKEQARVRLSIPMKDRVVLFFGVIRDYKGLDILLDAMTLIREDHIKVLIAGEFYNNASIFLDQIKKNKLENSVFLFDSFIPDDQVKEFFCAADVVVQPYKNATQSGITQICYHFNKPMIVTNVGGLPEMIEDGVVGYVVEPNAKEISRAIQSFYLEEKESVMIHNVQQAKSKYAWNSFTKEILSYI